MIHKFVIELTDDVKGYQHDIERLEREYGIEPIEEHNKQIRTEIIDEVKESINEHLFNSPMMNPIMTRNEILLFLEQLKED